MRVEVAQEVPGGVDEGVHRVGLPAGGLSALRAVGLDPVGGSCQRTLPLGRVVLDLRQQNGKLVFGDRHQSTPIAVDDRNRRAPVALTGNEPIAQAVVDGRLPPALLAEPVEDLVVRLAIALSVEVAGVEHGAVTRVGQPLFVARYVGIGSFNHPLDWQIEGLGEFVIAQVVAGDSHDRSRPVLHQHIIGDEDGDLLAVDRIGHRAAGCNTGLGSIFGGALDRAGLGGLLQVLGNSRFVFGPLHQLLDQRMLRGEHEEGRAKESVGSGGEDGEIEVEFIATEDDLSTFRAPDPVALHRDHVLRPGLEQIEVIEQTLRVVGDAEEPLLKFALFDFGSATLATAVDHLFVGQHRGIGRTPLHRRLLAVSEPLLEQLEKDPLRPAVIRGLMCAQLT